MATVAKIIFGLKIAKISLELFLETKSKAKVFLCAEFQHEREICSIFLRNVPWFLIVRVQRCIAVDSLGRRDETKTAAGQNYISGPFIFDGCTV